jgi:hypothetical protein
MRNAFVSEALILKCEPDRMQLRWVRDHDDLDDDRARAPMTTSDWNFGHGGFELARSVIVGPSGPEPGRNDFFELEPNLTIALVSPPRDWMHFGYAIEEPWARTWTTDRSVFVPPWFAFLLCAGPTIVLGRHLWREHRTRLRTKHGLCETCAYDLRGAARERCPECGEMVVGSACV